MRLNRFSLAILTGLTVMAWLCAGGGELRAGAGDQVAAKQIILYLQILENHARITQVQIRNLPYNEPKAGYRGDMRIELLSEHNAVLYEKRFESTVMTFWDKVDPQTGKIVDGGSETKTLTNFEINLPDFQNASRVKIYRQKVLQRPKPHVFEQLIGVIQLPRRCDWDDHHPPHGHNGHGHHH